MNIVKSNNALIAESTVLLTLLLLHLRIQTCLCVATQSESSIKDSESFDRLGDEYYVDQEREIKEELARKSDPKYRAFQFDIPIPTTSKKPDLSNTKMSPKTLPLPPELEQRKVTYEDGVKSLKCDSPWFWNTFECVWLDVRNQNIILRTKNNAKVAGIFGGIVSSIVLLPIFAICVMRACINRRLKAMEKRADEVMDKLRPGVFVHPDGSRRYYDPTPEEQEAFEELLLCFASVY